MSNFFVCVTHMLVYALILIGSGWNWLINLIIQDDYPYISGFERLIIMLSFGAITTSVFVALLFLIPIMWWLIILASWVIICVINYFIV